ncbi:MAG: NADH pyrophosphatase [Micrococcales bacterium 73-13]|nr:MAG: NADH pyrophosphatase [Micrococcales bacterium 73-13]
MSQESRSPGELPLSRSAIDRDHAAREREGLLDALWADPATRILPILDGQALLASPQRLTFLAPDALARPAVSAYLGRTVEEAPDAPAGTPIVAALLEDAAHLAEADWRNLRQIGDALSARDAGLFTQALAILNWHASHPFSPRTGEATVVESAGWVRRDPVGGDQVFPRTDPAVIVAVTDHDDRLLLGSNAMWETNRYSLLAGFVDPGESLEAAVVREIEEESGLRVVEPRYAGSQPWPFPASLMVGFTARLAPDQDPAPRPDGVEILDLRWFSREELAAALGEIRLPMRTSIARALIERWFGGPLDA